MQALGIGGDGRLRRVGLCALGKQLIDSGPERTTLPIRDACGERQQNQCQDQVDGQRCLTLPDQHASGDGGKKQWARA
ncbi:MAG: hypothetical protein AW09_004072 [Candidatus Accumulibacter phosphatis]|uniref:Uncharacterized protein n=1 Tax=Candidatus Accumulibacter phosphatis TaxID=327160 RepID=A0A080LRJ9_9PROT|nr:MAG: hypothetical protein AW09_004072 [Candidatus Accumulibacter phosphatis]